MNLEEFYKRFLEEVESGNQRSLKKVYHQTSNYTVRIFNKLEKCIKSFGYKAITKDNSSKDGTYFQKEYARIDLTGWTRNQVITKAIYDKKFITKTDKTVALKNIINVHSWILDFALEHENDYSDWTDEVMKLLSINCRLRIVIGYSDRINGSDKIYLEAVTQTITELSKLSDNRKWINENDEFGIILGEGNTTPDRSNSEEFEIGFKCYQVYYDKQSSKYNFKEIPS